MSANPYRTHTCNDLRASHAGQSVRLAGWIHNKRALGGVLFIDLRDHYGITQIVIPPTVAFQDAVAHLPKETVISVQGNVRPRPDGTVNKNLATGDIELDVTSYDKLGAAESLPMNVFPEDNTPEDTRLKYRFLDLRRSKLHQTVMLRADLLKLIETLNPNDEPGRITLISRMGAERVETKLPPLLRAVQSEGRRVLWLCDAMHGNTISTASKVKTRSFDAILSELRYFFDAMGEEACRPAGVHVEMTGQPVTECVGGAHRLTEADLGDRYETFCDPRLNAEQSLELSFLVAEELKARRGASHAAIAAQ